MDNARKKPPAVGHQSVAENAERRRIGKILHDDRGNAFVDWRDAPADYQRPVLEIEGERPKALSIQTAPRHFNPYERPTLQEEPKAAAPRKDLKKLSEWIKLMRELEERKRKGEVD
jgi:hypothetical protein